VSIPENLRPLPLNAFFAISCVDFIIILLEIPVQYYFEKRGEILTSPWDDKKQYISLVEQQEALQDTLQENPELSESMFMEDKRLRIFAKSARNNQLVLHTEISFDHVENWNDFFKSDGTLDFSVNDAEIEAILGKCTQGEQ